MDLYIHLYNFYRRLYQGFSLQFWNFQPCCHRCGRNSPSNQVKAVLHSYLSSRLCYRLKDLMTQVYRVRLWPRQKKTTQLRVRPHKFLSTCCSQWLFWRTKAFSTRQDHVPSMACLLRFHSYHCGPSKTHNNPFPCLKHIPTLLLLTRADAVTSAKLETCWHWPVLITDLCSGISSISSYEVHMAVFPPPLPPYLLLILWRSGVLYVFCSVSPWAFHFCWHFPKQY